MRPIDWTEGQPEDTYMFDLIAWEQRRNELEAEQRDKADALVVADTQLDRIREWADGMGRFASTVGVEAGQLQSIDVTLRAIDADLGRVAGELTDHTEARELATARLLGGPRADVPLVLLPLRLETRWADGALHVRIYPDDIAVDAHDPGLTEDEITWAEHFWRARAGDTADGAPGPADPEETWQQLVRRFGPARAAWLVRAGAPGQPPLEARPDPWPRPARARLLPDRFAVVALAGGVPVNLAPTGSPPRYVTWGTPVADPLPIAPLDTGATGEGPPWWSDLGAARLAGMAITIPLGKATPTIEALAVVGLRGGRVGDPAGPALAALLDAHAVSAGAELLADGTATNNSGARRAAYGPVAQERAARAVRDAALDGTAVVHPHAAGARLADLLGLPTAALAPLAGATTDRDTLTGAARLLVGLGAQGALRQRLGAPGAGTWSRLEPGGPAPTLRIGRQPYGVLPATAPGRWAARAGEAGGGLVDALHEWAVATGPELFVDPGARPTPLGGGAARRVTNDDDADLADLLLEAAASVRWAPASDGAPGAPVDGPDGLVGPAEGDASPAVVLPIVAAAAPADLPGLPAAVRTASLLARIAVAAKRAAAVDAVAAVDAALGTLAAAPHDDLVRVVAELLDAASHRFDAWITAVATERLTAYRQDHPGEVAVGAFGWLTDVEPRQLPRSFGHVHAPSMAQAATAAVLRSGFLGQRRRAWASVVEQAEAALADAQTRLAASGPSDPVGVRQALEAQVAAATAHLAQARSDGEHLVPLDEATESHLPLAVDLSSRRVRGARSVLSAVRAGQPLAAVLGHQFERDLADAGLQQFLAAFRKLTRFPTGTALEQVEQARRDRQSELAAARRALADRQRTAAALVGPLQQARDAERATTERVVRADAAFAPFQALRTERGQRAQAVADLTTQLAHHNDQRPRPGRRPFQIRTP
jgi:hypothetical protein